jgi:hypothetical protein
MIRANLLPRPKETVALFGFEFDGEYVRQALIGFAIVVAIALLGIGIETLRMHRLGAAARDAETALAVRAPERTESQRLALAVARYQEIAREAAAVRRSGGAAAVEIARIGNAVPSRVWLDSLAHSSNGFDLVGGTTSVDTLSGAILTLGDALPGRAASLVSIDNRDAAADGIRFTARIAENAAPRATR